MKYAVIIVPLHEPSSTSEPLESGRQRRPCGGRKSSEQHLPGIVNALSDLVEGTTRGDTVKPLLRTGKSTRTLALELGRMAFSQTERLAKGAIIQTEMPSLTTSTNEYLHFNDVGNRSSRRIQRSDLRFGAVQLLGFGALHALTSGI